MRTCFDQLRPSHSCSIHFSAKNQILALLELDLRGLEEMTATETRPHFVSGSTVPYCLGKMIFLFDTCPTLPQKGVLKDGAAPGCLLPSMYIAPAVSNVLNLSCPKIRQKDVEI